MKRPTIKSLFNWKLIGIILFILVLWSIDTSKLITVLRGVHWTFLSLALVMQIVTLFLKSVRWNYLLSMMGFEVTFWKSFVLYVISGYMGVITPGRLGEFWKALRLKQEEKIPLVPGIFSAFLDRAMDLYLYIWVGMICAAGIGLMKEIPFIIQFLVLCFCACPILLVTKPIRNRLSSFVLPRGLLRRFGMNIENGLYEFEDSIEKINSRYIFIPVSITVVASGILFLQFWLILKSLGIELHFLLGAIIISLIKFIGNLPITLFGLGTRDVTLIFVFKLLGLSSSLAVGASVLIFLINHLAVSLFGFILLVVTRIPEGGRAIANKKL